MVKNEKETSNKVAKKKRRTSINRTLEKPLKIEELMKYIESRITFCIANEMGNYASNLSEDLSSPFRNILSDVLKEMRFEIESKLFRNINELRTIVLEQQRILESIKDMNKFDETIGMIKSGMPEIRNIIHTISKALE